MSTALASTAPAAMDFSQEQVELVKKQVMVGASNDELQLFLATCRRLQLDPFARQIYAVKRWSKERGEKWETQVSIDGFRLVASRSGDYQGQTMPQWCGHDGVWRDVWLEKTPPAAARVGVWRVAFKEPAWGIARYESYVQKTREGAANRMWATMPDVMLAKCAEALALRKAFPNDLSGVYTREEMGQAEVVEVESEPVVERAHPTVEVARRVFPEAQVLPHDAVRDEFLAINNTLRAIWPSDEPDDKAARVGWHWRHYRGPRDEGGPPCDWNPLTEYRYSSQATRESLKAKAEDLVRKSEPPPADEAASDALPAWADEMPKPDPEAGKKPRGRVTRAGGRVSEGPAKAGAVERGPGEDDNA